MSRVENPNLIHPTIGKLDSNNCIYVFNSTRDYLLYANSINLNTTNILNNYVSNAYLNTYWNTACNNASTAVTAAAAAAASADAAIAAASAAATAAAYADSNIRDKNKQPLKSGFWPHPWVYKYQKSVPPREEKLTHHGRSPDPPKRGFWPIPWGKNTRKASPHVGRS